MIIDEFVERRGEALLRYVTVVTADPDTARDVVQSVLERAYARWAVISTLDAPDAYVRKMAVNEFVSLRRRMARVFLTDRVVEPQPQPDHSDAYADTDALITEIRKLPARQRAAVTLRYWSDLTDAQITEEPGCRESTVRGYIWRAIRQLRVQLGEPGAPPLSTTRGVNR